MERQISIYQLIAFSIDFEGSISIEKRISKTGNINLSVRVRVHNTSKELLDNFANIIGLGKVSNKHISLGNRKDKYYWSLTVKENIKYLPLILPYLTLKWRQAELAIETLKIMKNSTYCNSLSYHARKEMYTYEEQVTLELIYKECTLLNKQGY